VRELRDLGVKFRRHDDGAREVWVNLHRHPEPQYLTVLYCTLVNRYASTQIHRELRGKRRMRGSNRPGGRVKGRTAMTTLRVVALFQSLESSRHRITNSLCCILCTTRASTTAACSCKWKKKKK